MTTVIEAASMICQGVASAVSRHRCTYRCSRVCPAAAQPPEGFMQRTANYLHPLGYRLIRNSTTMPDDQDGEVIGAFTQDEPELAMTMRVRKGLTPAREFAVVAHELSHVILGHPCHTEAEAVAEHNRRMRWYIPSGGLLCENPHNEMACELASAITLARAGLPPDPKHVCYLAQRQAFYRVSLHDSSITSHAEDAAEALRAILLPQ